MPEASVRDAARPDGASTADAATLDGARATCLDWGPFEAPLALTEVNSSSSDLSPTLTADMLEIFFTSFRGGNEDIWVAKRRSVADPFDPPTPLAEVNTADEEQDPDISPDGSTLFFSRAGAGIWEAKRLTRRDPFGGASRLNIAFDGGDEPTRYGGASYASDITLYFSVGPWSPAVDHDIYTATRDPSGTSWSATLVAGLSTPEHEGFPSISRDQLQLFFDADWGGDLDIVVVQRADARTGWALAGYVVVPLVSTPGVVEQDPDISPDGTTLCFDRRTADGDLDIWCASRACARIGT